MMQNTKPVESLQVSDLKTHPVWEFVKAGETIIRPVTSLPVDHLMFRLVGTRVRLANGDLIWADAANVNALDPVRTRQFLTLTVFHNAKRFTLARYFDFDYADSGPEALALFLSLPVDQVFPISYDISAYVVGHATELSGVITKEPRERLTRAQIIALAAG